MKASRRHFLAGATAAAAGSVLGKDPANDRIKVGVIGIGAQGRRLAYRCAREKGVEVVGICDVMDDRRRMSTAAFSDVDTARGKTGKGVTSKQKRKAAAQAAAGKTTPAAGKEDAEGGSSGKGTAEKPKRGSTKPKAKAASKSNANKATESKKVKPSASTKQTTAAAAAPVQGKGAATEEAPVAPSDAETKAGPAEPTKTTVTDATEGAEQQGTKSPGTGSTAPPSKDVLGPTTIPAGPAEEEASGKEQTDADKAPSAATTPEYITASPKKTVRFAVPKPPSNEGSAAGSAPAAAAGEGSTDDSGGSIALVIEEGSSEENAGSEQQKAADVEAGQTGQREAAGTGEQLEDAGRGQQEAAGMRPRVAASSGEATILDAVSLQKIGMAGAKDPDAADKDSSREKAASEERDLLDSSAASSLAAQSSFLEDEGAPPPGQVPFVSPAEASPDKQTEESAASEKDMDPLQ